MSEFADDPLAGRDIDLLKDMGYEPIDHASEGPVGKYAVWFFGFLVLMLGAAWMALSLLPAVVKAPDRTDLAPRPMMPKENVPLIQSNATAAKDMVDLRKEEAKKLNTTAWADASHKVAKIPVEEAMHIVAERGVPSDPSLSQVQTAGGG